MPYRCRVSILLERFAFDLISIRIKQIHSCILSSFHSYIIHFSFSIRFFHSKIKKSDILVIHWFRKLKSSLAFFHFWPDLYVPCPRWRRRHLQQYFDRISMVASGRRSIVSIEGWSDRFWRRLQFSVSLKASNKMCWINLFITCGTTLKK